MPETNHNNNIMIPLAIIVAGILIAGAVFYSSGSKQAGKDNFAAQVGQQIAKNGGSNATIRPVTDQDHVFGNPDAPVKIVEFSDTECPFCKRFHQTMKQVLDEYGKNGQVAWVYRHFPLDAIHPKARKEAEATECANELGGNDKFWAYLDRIFEITSSNNNLDPKELSEIATYVGLDKARFSQCLNSGKYAQHVADDLSDAQNSGGNAERPGALSLLQTAKQFP